MSNPSSPPPVAAPVRVEWPTEEEIAATIYQPGHHFADYTRVATAMQKLESMREDSHLFSTERRAVLTVLEYVSELGVTYRKLREEVRRLRADAARLDWLERVMTPRDAYVEVYLAGLRSGHADATAYQVEFQPLTQPAIQGTTLRAAIDAAMSPPSAAVAP